MKSVLRVIVTEGAVLCPLMKLIEGDPARLWAHMRGSWRDSLTHGDPRLSQDQLNISQQLSKKEQFQGATSRGNPQVRKK